MAKKEPFLTDVKTLRKRARQHIQQGAVTSGYRADRATVIKLLNEALATEIVCVLRYKRHFYMAQGPHAAAAKEEFSEHATAELSHADRIAERIVQLGGAPDFNWRWYSASSKCPFDSASRPSAAKVHSS